MKGIRALKLGKKGGLNKFSRISSGEEESRQNWGSDQKDPIEWACAPQCKERFVF